MNMIFENCHNLILIKVRNPMKEGKQESLRVSVKPFTHTKYGHMIVNELHFIFVSFKGVNKKAFLKPISRSNLLMKEMNIS